jgi:hypothetical protein
MCSAGAGEGSGAWEISAVSSVGMSGLAAMRSCAMEAGVRLVEMSTARWWRREASGEGAGSGFEMGAERVVDVRRRRRAKRAVAIRGIILRSLMGRLWRGEGERERGRVGERRGRRDVLAGRRLSPVLGICSKTRDKCPV